MIRYFLALLVLVPMLALPAETAALDCYDEGCYGTVYWDGGTHGSTVEITVQPNAYVNNGNSFISNEMWLSDSDASSGDTCEVLSVDVDPLMEVGIDAIGGQLRYFWIRCPPGGTYYRQLGAIVPSGDYYQQTYFKINRSDKPGGEDDYKIWIASPTLGTMTGYSYNNSMSPDRIRIGMEVATDAGYWQGSTFSKNRYIIGANYDNYVYQWRDGDGKKVDNPPSAGWITVPDHGNQGGSWYTTCGTC